MTALLATVARSGLATVQDGGRRGFADVGVPVAGALHSGRYLQATAAIRGAADPSCPAVEILAGDLVLATHVPVVACLVGSASWTVDGRRAAVAASVLVPGGVEVHVRHRGPGPTYLTVAGWSPARTLGSASTDTFSRLGGGALSAGLALTGDPAAAIASEVGLFHRLVPDATGPVRVVASGHELLGEFAGRSWQVRDVARSGVRMSGVPMSGSVLPSTGTVASAPMIVGAIQLTPSGEAIILGPDGGLTGGYPVVGVIATVDLDRVSLLRPGDRTYFRVVDVDDAARAHRQRAERLRRSLTRVHLLG
jgi:allophanate hydrolase subunit 2